MRAVAVAACWEGTPLRRFVAERGVVPGPVASLPCAEALPALARPAEADAAWTGWGGDATPCPTGLAVLAFLCAAKALAAGAPQEIAHYFLDAAFAQAGGGLGWGLREEDLAAAYGEFLAKIFLTRS